ncbi:MULTISPECIES: cytochrome P450 [unclassified Streptosporangium]|uniref:cytochrome P450 n=1 Tax=unclassified Streptosporangium TaxID=2632669 RepID=UPI002E2979EF|nr:MULTISPECIES: cytochrome P450 [unclassified Streptosporangium]
MATVGESDRTAPDGRRPWAVLTGGLPGGAARWYRRDPLGFVERAARERGPVFRLPDDGSLCVADPVEARRVLHDEEGHYDEVSDFFHVRGGRLGPRETQIAIGRAARATVRAHLAAHRERLPAVVAELGEVSEWPSAGRAATHRFLAEALLRPDSPPALRDLMARVVERDVLIRSGGRTARAARMALWARVVRAVAGEVRARRTGPRPGRPGDLLDAVLGSTPPDTPATQVAQVYLLLFRTSVAPVGHVVAWALLEAATHGVDLAAVPAESAVRESLRLWPVAWLLGRPVRHAHQVGGVRLEPGESVSVCVYLLHRDDRHWPQATRFRPDRWDDSGPRGAYLPFGGGPFTCAGAAVAQALATALLAAVTDNARLEVRGGHGRPHVAGIITPPSFQLRRTPTGP